VIYWLKSFCKGLCIVFNCCVALISVVSFCSRSLSFEQDNVCSIVVLQCVFDELDEQSFASNCLYNESY
jgi:hypothetical protein